MEVAKRRFRFVPFQDKSVKGALEQQRRVTDTENNIWKAVVCLIMTVAIGVEMQIGLVVASFNCEPFYVWLFEMCLVVSLLMAGGWSMYQYVKPQLNKVQLTEKQQQLLGVQKEAAGFATSRVPPAPPSWEASPMLQSSLSPQQVIAPESRRLIHQSGGQYCTPTHLSSDWDYMHDDLPISDLPYTTTYHSATRSPSSPEQQVNIWAELNIRKDVLEVWTENCRKWIGQSVLQPLTKEIDHINAKLISMGYEQYRIGQVGLNTLQHIATSEAATVPTLGLVLPYLEVSSKQDYLCQRIKELGGDSCLSKFKWNGGAVMHGRSWNIDLPTDSQIVMHALSCYLDANLVPLPLSSEKKFSQVHFLKTPARPSDKRGDICIYQSSVNPPHFKVLVDKEVTNIPKGHNNLFHAVIYFLYQVQQKNSGMLGSVNINLSSVNILWIISDSK